MRLWECGEIGGGSAVVSRVVVLAMMYTQSITYMDIEGESLSSHDLFSGEISETFLSLTCLGMKMFIVQFPPNNHSWFLSTNLPKKPFPWLTSSSFVTHSLPTTTWIKYGHFSISLLSRSNIDSIDLRPPVHLSTYTPTRTNRICAGAAVAGAASTCSSGLFASSGLGNHYTANCPVRVRSFPIVNICCPSPDMTFICSHFTRPTESIVNYSLLQTPSIHCTTVPPPQLFMATKTPTKAKQMDN